MALTIRVLLQCRAEDGWVQARQAISQMSVVLKRKKEIPSVRTCVRARSVVLVDFICASITGKGAPGEKMALLHIDLGMIVRESSKKYYNNNRDSNERTDKSGVT